MVLGFGALAGLAISWAHAEPSGVRNRASDCLPGEVFVSVMNDRHRSVSQCIPRSCTQYRYNPSARSITCGTINVTTPPSGGGAPVPPPSPLPSASPSTGPAPGPAPVPSPSPTGAALCPSGTHWDGTVCRDCSREYPSSDVQTILVWSASQNDCVSPCGDPKPGVVDKCVNLLGGEYYCFDEPRGSNRGWGWDCSAM